ncbi:hypothetical protein GCM10027168_16260 [Streptomyces capparidis]
MSAARRQRPDPPPARLYVGRVLRHLRCRAGLSQKEVGELLHVTGALVNMAESGRRAIPARELTRADELLCADGLLTAAIPLLDAERHDHRDHGPALRRARAILDGTALPPLTDPTRRHIAALALWALAPPGGGEGSAAPDAPR